MQLNVTGHHIEVTAALRGYVEKKLERIARHFDQVIDVHCMLTVEKLRQKAEATLHVSGNAIHAEATEENMYAAIDLLVDKLDRCVKKHKEKKSDHHATEARRRCASLTHRRRGSSDSDCPAGRALESRRRRALEGAAWSLTRRKGAIGSQIAAVNPRSRLQASCR